MPDGTPDPEITDMLRELQGGERHAEADAALPRYRREALAGARDRADRGAKEELVRQARERLRRLLGWPPAAGA